MEAFIIIGTKINVIDMKFKVDILGAGREVGRSCVIVTWYAIDGADIGGFTGFLPCKTSANVVRIMFDCGYHIIDKVNRIPDFHRWLGINKNISDIELGIYLSERINIVLITHFHLDHIGALPYLLLNLNFTSPVYSSLATKNLAEFIMYEVVKDIGEIGNNQSITNTINAIKPLPIGTRTRLKTSENENVIITTHNAGHTIGAVVYEVTYRSRTCVYSGDINLYSGNMTNGLIYYDSIREKQCDLLVCESTYAMIEKEGYNATNKELISTILTALQESNYKILIPCLSVCKAQEIASVIYTALKDLNIRQVPLYLAGYTSCKAQVVYRYFLNDTVYTTNYNHNNDSNCNDFSVSNVRLFNDIMNFKKPISNNSLFWTDNSNGILLASPSMLTGGNSLKAFELFADSPNNMIIFIGSCANGTVGKQVLNGAKTITIPNSNKTVNVQCKVRYCAYSMHAGHSSLKKFIEFLDPTSIVFVHGEYTSMANFGKYCQQNYNINCYCPNNYESIYVDITDTTELVSFNIPLKLLDSKQPVISNGVIKFEPIHEKSYKNDGEEKKYMTLYERLLYPPVWPEIDSFLYSLSESNKDESEEGEIVVDMTTAKSTNVCEHFRNQFLINLIKSGVQLPRSWMQSFCNKFATFLKNVPINETENFKLPTIKLQSALNRSVVVLVGTIGTAFAKELISASLPHWLPYKDMYDISFIKTTIGCLLDFGRDDIVMSVVNRFEYNYSLSKIRSRIINVQTNANLNIDNQLLKLLKYSFVFMQTGDIELLNNIVTNQVNDTKIYKSFFKKFINRLIIDTAKYANLQKTSAPNDFTSAVSEAKKPCTISKQSTNVNIQFPIQSTEPTAKLSLPNTAPDSNLTNSAYPPPPPNANLLKKNERRIQEKKLQGSTKQKHNNKNNTKNLHTTLIDVTQPYNDILTQFNNLSNNTNTIMNSANERNLYRTPNVFPPPPPAIDISNNSNTCNIEYNDFIINNEGLNSNINEVKESYRNEEKLISSSIVNKNIITSDENTYEAFTDFNINRCLKSFNSNSNFDSYNSLQEVKQESADFGDVNAMNENNLTSDSLSLNQFFLKDDYDKIAESTNEQDNTYSVVNLTWEAILQKKNN